MKSKNEKASLLNISHSRTSVFCTVILILLSLSLHAQITKEVVPGVAYTEYYRDEGPWAIQVVEIDRNATHVNLEAVLGGNYVLGIEPLERIIERATKPGHFPVAAINGDFYILRIDPFQGDPVGFCVVNGEFLSSPVDRSAFVIFDDGTLAIKRFTFEGILRQSNGEQIAISGINQKCPPDGIVILTDRFFSSTRSQKNSFQVLAGPVKEHLASEGTYAFSVSALMENDSVLALPEGYIAFIGLGTGSQFLEQVSKGDELYCTMKISPSVSDIKQAVGGTPRLLRNGVISIEAQEEHISQAFVDNRHPRTALGFNDEKIFLVTVDGRQPGYSAGMNLPEIAEFLLELGAREALNLDGGGSTTMWVSGKIRNRPSDGIIRPIANALVLFSTIKSEK